MQKTSVDFVIPTASSKSSLLARCQKSIFAQSGPFEKRMFIEEGYGFAKGVNRGIRKGKSPYIALINDDVVLEKNWVEEALRVLETHPHCAAVATRVLTYDGKYIDSCGMDILVEGKARRRGNGQKDSNKFNREEEVFGVPCSAALLRREALEKVKLFDEDFIAYEEDVDISFRLRLSGYSIFYAPYAVAFHKIHATSDTLGNFKVRMDAKNWIFIIIKNYPFKLILSFLPQIVLERGRNLIGLIKETVRIYHWQSFLALPWSLFVTYIDVGSKLPGMLHKRKEIQENTRVEYADLVTWMKNI